MLHLLLDASPYPYTAPFFGIFAGLMGMGFFFMLGSLMLGIIAFWIWMLIDCVQRDFPPAEQNAKVIWVLVIALTGWLGALLYFLIVKKGKVRL